LLGLSTMSAMADDYTAVFTGSAASAADSANFQAFLADMKKGVYRPTQISPQARQVYLLYAGNFSSGYIEKFIARKASGTPLTTFEQSQLDLIANAREIIAKEIATNPNLAGRYQTGLSR
jgi:hypothetical protein